MQNHTPMTSADAHYTVSIDVWFPSSNPDDDYDDDQNPDKVFNLQIAVFKHGSHELVITFEKDDAGIYGPTLETLLSNNLKNINETLSKNGFPPIGSFEIVGVMEMQNDEDANYTQKENVAEIKAGTYGALLKGAEYGGVDYGETAKLEKLKEVVSAYLKGLL